jgi:predicted AlkP superfamily phosphohydrolase/phosphomutase
MMSACPSPINILTAHPKELEEKLRREYPAYRVDIDYIDPDYRKLHKRRFVSEILRIVKERHDVALNLLNRCAWDFFFVVFTMCDRVQHVFWPYIDDEYRRVIEDREEFRGAISRLYSQLDRMTGSLISAAGNETITFVVSDHGFESVYKNFGIGNWLVEKDLAVHASLPQKYRYQFAKFVYKKISTTGILDTNRVFDKLPEKLRSFILPRAASLSSVGGVSYRELKLAKSIPNLEQNLVKALYAVEDPETGQKVIQKVFSKREIYHGDAVGNAYDLIVLPSSGYRVVKWTKGYSIEEVPWHSGTHASVKNRHTVASVYDIVPTVLWLLGIDPPELDGKILKENFELPQRQSWATYAPSKSSLRRKILGVRAKLEP